MNEWRNDERGFTLAEVLVASALLALLAVTITGFLGVGQATSHHLATWGDQSQQLRLALQQMEEDLTFAQWDSTLNAPQANTVAAIVHLPFATANAVDPAGWPGDLKQWRRLRITYRLEGETLIREISEDISGGRTFSRQAVSSGLDLTSLLQMDATNYQIRVLLRAKRMTELQGGGERNAEVYAQFYLRQVPSNVE